jgi:ubiquitin thioesterase protein OTUB1
MEQWTMHTAQQDMLQREIEESQPLIGTKELHFTSLENQFQPLPHGQGEKKKGFLLGIEGLKLRKYSGFRRIRGDGNCFFRGFMFRLVETIVEQVSFSGLLGSNHCRKRPLWFCLVPYV